MQICWMTKLKANSCEHELVMEAVVLHYQKMGQLILMLKNVTGVTSRWKKRPLHYHQIETAANVFSESHSSEMVIPEHVLISDFALHKQSASFQG